MTNWDSCKRNLPFLERWAFLAYISVGAGRLQGLYGKQARNFSRGWAKIAMMGGGPGGWGGWMHGSVGGGPGVGGGWMMGGGGLGFGIAGLVWGFLSGAVAGAITAWVYNAMVRRAE
jgi:hypothetical protein